MNHCPSSYVAEDGFRTTCDLEEGHAGLHSSEEYDEMQDCFRWFEWANVPLDDAAPLPRRGASAR